MFRKVLAWVAICSSLFSENYTIAEEGYDPEICEQILGGLNEFNMEFFHKRYESVGLEPFLICVRDEQENLLGGICGYTCWGTASGTWTCVDYVWVSKDLRHQGIGTELFRRVEDLAQRNGANRIQLFTWAYQAIGFYKKLGFICVGTIPQWIDGYDAVFFIKRLEVADLETF